MSHTKKSWSVTPQGEQVYLHTISNDSGFQAGIATYGATLVELKVPVSNGQTVDAVLGFDDLTGYLNDPHYIGATVGRVAGRISHGSFELDGEKYFLDKNEGDNQLHGGKFGFNSRIWTECQAENPEPHTISLCYESPDGEGGYPGNLQVTVTYSLIENGLRIAYRAVTGKPTPINMTAHPYFNLNGDGKDTGEHEVKIFSDKTLFFDDEILPNGETLDVSGTEADYTDFCPINGPATDSQIETAPLKHDRFYILNLSEMEMPVAAVVRSDASGMELEIATTQSGLQFYSADYIGAGTKGKLGCEYGPRSGFCLEPEGYPDAVNRPEFPSVILRPGEVYNHVTEYRFREFNKRD
ncbi:aldose epimerase family protein [Desulfovibrio gilichinskyi]|uniref:Aldose 1-epimerase n=1 Tax=Desulfovibrio gilichinskyi TaxID=1519643 RepID=A0A1X7D6E2_9BACT|nr:aldose epimerase family protein [Desulfovibrio gilichinskyi]SMF09698.1 aldose 1-epimerase [Desulfovibrio gilichinskyi]